MKNLIILISFILSISCDKKEVKPFNNTIPNVQISYKYEESKLLSFTSSCTYKTDSIKGILWKFLFFQSTDNKYIFMPSKQNITASIEFIKDDSILNVSNFANLCSGKYKVNPFTISNANICSKIACNDTSYCQWESYLSEALNNSVCYSMSNDTLSIQFKKSEKFGLIKFKNTKK